jgi:NhaA family Na+:H+ antiporter
VHSHSSLARVHPIARRIFRPLERFLKIEASSGVVLLAATAAALTWANSPWSSLYEAAWDIPIGFAVPGVAITQSLHFWINEALMTIFFLVVGLEIRREAHDGALSDHRIALLPVIAALGGVIVPAVIYLAVNLSGPGQQGWAVPTATDIAFALGVLTLLARRVPPALRTLLLTLAIVDDIAAILLIAGVYSSGVALLELWIAASGVLAVLGLQALRVRSALAYALPGVLVWIGLLRAGVHPTLAGVLLGLLTPASASFGQGKNDRHTVNVPTGADACAARAVESRVGSGGHARWEQLSPAARVEARLHPWVAYGIMPLFAFANAGVQLHPWGPAASIAWGITCGLVLGKPAGILLATWMAVRLKWCVLPVGIKWSHMLVLGILGGIGFTMSIFIAGLAFPDAASLATAKSAVLAASCVAAILAVVVGWLILPRAR